MANKVQIQVGYTTDRTGLQQLQSALNEIIVQAKLPGAELNTGLQQAARTAKTLEEVFDKAFNADLGTLNVNRFNQELLKTDISIQSIKNSLSGANAIGATAFNALSSDILNTNVAIKQSSKLLDSLAESMSNTIKWGVTSSIFNNIAGAIERAVSYAGQLDRSLNDIRIVTDKNVESMARFAQEANNAAKNLGANTLDYTRASLIYYQQGLAEEEARARAEVTLKAANVTGQTGQAVSEQLTAVWNGYKVTAQETELYVDKLAAVAATTAADLEELSTGMSRVASAANLMGVDVDQLNAQLATIISVTRQAPESVGVALRSVYARMSDIQAGLDTETTLDNYTKQMAKMGISVLDTNKELRDMGDVIEEVGDKWNTYSREQQVFLAQAMAGTRQYNNILALFDNWSMYTDAIETSRGALGTLQHQQDIYMESTDAKLKTLKATWQDLYSGLIDTNELNTGIEAITNLVQVFDNFIDSFGGGSKSILAFGTLVANVFNKQIASAITTATLNTEKYAQNANLLEKKLSVVNAGVANAGPNATPQDVAMQQRLETELKYAKQIQQIRSGMSSDQYNELTNMQQQMGQLEYEATLTEQIALSEAKKVDGIDQAKLGEASYLETLASEVESRASAVELTEELTKNVNNQLKGANELLNIDSSETALYQELLALKESLSRTDQDRENIESRVSEETKEQLNAIIDLVGEQGHIFSSEKEIRDIKARILRIIQDINKEEQAGLAAAQARADAAERYQSAQERAAELRTRIGELDQDFGQNIDFAQRASMIGAQVASITSLLSGAAMAWGSFNSVLQTWGDETASIGDKITQTVMSMGIAIPSLIHSFQTLTTSIKGINLVTMAMNSIYGLSREQVGLLAKELITLHVTKEKDIATTSSQALAEELLGKKYTEASLAERLKIQAAIDNIKTQVLEEGATDANTVATNLNTKAVHENIAAYIASHAALIPVVAAIAALGVAIYAGVRAYNEDARAAKESSEAASELKSRYDSVKNSYEELKSSFSDYNEAKNGLDQLVRGTEEWNEQLTEVNNKVLDLLEAFPKLSSGYIKNVNGVLTISEEGQQQLLREQQDSVNKLLQTTRLMSVQANNDAIESRITNYSRMTGINDNQLVHNLINAINANDIDLSLNDEDLIVQLQEVGRELGYLPAHLAQAIGNYKPQLRELIDSVNANTESNNLIVAEAGKNLLQQNGSIYGNNEQLGRIIGMQLEPKLQQKIDEYTNTIFGKWSDEEIQDEFVKQSHGKYVASVNESGNKGSYITATGEVEQIDDAVVRAQLAMQAAQDEMAGELSNYTTAFENISTAIQDSSKPIQNVLLDFVSGVNNIDELTQKQVDLLLSAAKNISESDLEVLGTTSDKLTHTVENAIESYYTAVGNITSGMARDAKEAFEAFEKQGLDNKTLGERQTVASIFDLAAAYGKLGEAVNAFDTESIEGLREFAKELVPIGSEAASASANFVELSKVLKSLKTGDTISPEDYERLSEEGKEYFRAMNDGTYELIRSAESLKEITQEDFVSAIRDQIGVLRTDNQNIRSVQDYDINELSRNQAKTENGEVNTKNVQKQIDLVVALGDQSDETARKIQRWREELARGNLNYDDYEEIAQAVSNLGDAFDKSEEKLQINTDSINQWARTLFVSCDSIKELEKYLDEVGEEGLDAFNERLHELQNTIDSDIDTESLSELTETLQDVADDTEGIGTELADYLTKDKEAAEDVAEAILRFDDACKDVVDSYEEWLSALESGDLQEQAEIMNDLRDAYADLLDMDGSSLPETFLRSADNLKLMREAIDGNIDAYNQLLQNAGEQILIECGIDTTQFETDKAYIEGLINEINWDDINVKATVEYSQFLNGLSDIINAAGMTAAQATDYLASMGIDAEVEAVKTEATDRREVNNLIAHPVDNLVSGTDPASGNPVTYNFPSVTYTSEPADIIENKENTAFTLRVKSANKSSGGGFKFNQSKNGGGSAGKARRAGKGGGGGGGGGNTKQPSVEKHIEKQADRYHDINQQIEKIDRGLDKVRRDQDKLSGEDLLDNLNEQLDILEKQKALYENKIRLEKDEAAELRNVLAAQGATFDSQGYLDNYTAVLQAKLNYVNTLIDQYNLMTAEEQEKFKEVIEQAQKDYDELEKNINRYDEIRNEVSDLEEQFQDAVDEQIEINIKKFTAEIEIRLDMAEAERDFNEFRRKVLNGIKDDDILGNAKADIDEYFSYLETYDTGIGPIEALTDQVYKTMDEVEAIADDGYSEIYGKNSQKVLEDLDTYYTELMEQLEDMEDLSDQIKESYLDMIDQAIDEFDNHVDQFDYINDLLNHSINLVGLIYGDDAYSEMDNYYRQIEANNNEELKFLRERVNYAHEMMQMETDPKAREKWIEEWQNSLEELNDKVEDSVQNILDKYSNLIEQVFDKLNDKVTGGLGLDYVGEEWDLINRNSERYLDNINKMQALQELENKYLEGIANTDDLVAQQKLKGVMDEQLAYLREKDKLTEYDVERANMMYDLTLKQIALENAQQTKTNLRLRRDSQGNYTYQYVADEDELEKKRQELLAAQNDLYNFDKDQYIQNLDDLYSIYEEFQQKLKELYLDPTIDPEERLRREQLLTQQYGSLINGIIKENTYIRDNLYDSAFEDLALLYDTDVENFKDMSQEEQDELMNNLIPEWDSGVQHMADTFAGNGGFIPTCTEAFGELSEATKDYQDDLDEIEDVAETSFDKLQDGISEGIDETRDLISENDELISKYRDGLVPAIKEVIDTLEDIQTEYGEVMEAAKEAAEAAYELAQARREAAAEADWDDDYEPEESSNIGPNILQNAGPVQALPAPTPTTTSSSGSSGNSGYTPKKKEPVETFLFEGPSGNKYNKGDKRWLHPNYVMTTPSAISAIPVKSISPGSMTIIGYMKGKEYPVHVSMNGKSGWVALSHFASGGYTGDWAGDEGKAAILHKKELVLNQEDTKNILSAVNVVRHMDELISNLNVATSIHTNNLLSGLGMLSNSNYSNSSSIDQNVHITAEFPGVRDSREIEEALNNLVNAASMHAFNTRR